MVDRQVSQCALDLVPHPSHRDTENTLAAGDKVHDLIGGGALVDRGTVAHQGNGGQVLYPARVQGADRRADLLQGNPGVQKPLDDLEDQDVAERVEALGARALGATDRGLNEARTGPVVELTIGDACGTAGHRTSVTRVGVELRKRVAEQHALSTLRPCYRTGFIHAHGLLLSPEGNAPEDGAAARFVRPRLHDRAS